MFAKWRGRGGVVSAVSDSTGGAIDADVADKAVNDTGDDTAVLLEEASSVKTVSRPMTLSMSFVRTRR